MTDIARPRPSARLALAAAATALAAAAGTLAVPAQPADATTVTARSLLLALPVAAEDNTAYDRALFPHWADADRDCQNTRAEVLVAESRTTVAYTTAARCAVARGSWKSPWDGATWTAPGDVDIDHHVALSEAWGSGARTWTTTVRKAYANDLYGPALNAVTDNVNSAKGDRDPAEWLPPLTSTHCAYATTWVQVKYRWRLTVNAAERTRLAGLMSGACGDRSAAVPVRAR